MMTREKQQQLKVIITVSAVVVAVIILISLIYNVVKLITVNSYNRTLEQQLEQINVAITENSSEIEYKETEEYIDKYAREYLNMRGEDEITFIGK